MNTNEEQKGGTAALPHAIIQKKKGISFVWFIPIVAVIIAAGLVYKAVTEKGPTITITFETAEGLEADKTKIKYKDVVIGEVTAIDLASDLKNITVTAELEKGAKKYLTEKTNFWVVRARFSAGIASGLGTILSGSYILMDPSSEGAATLNFKGLEIPPVVTSKVLGRHFQLKAPHLGSVTYGSPIYFKGIDVGQVVGYEFSDKNRDLDIKIFINAPYDRYIFDTTRFWFASGLDMTLDADGIRLDTESLVSMMIGGLAFANPDKSLHGSPAEDGYVFPLYDSRDDAMAQRFAIKDYYLLKFHNSVRGLSIGAPVEFRGFPFGQVVDIGLEADWEKNETKIVVKIEVEPERLQQFIEKNVAPANALKKMVGKGLRAQLQTGNLITGSLFVAIDMFKTASPAHLVMHDDIIELPTIPASLDEITSNVTALLANLSKIPVEDIGSALLDTINSFDETSKSFKTTGDGINKIIYSDSLKKSIASLNQSMEHIQRLTSEFEQKLPPAIDSISEQTTATLGQIEKLAASDSPIIFELKQALTQFTKTAQSIKKLTDYLERHPESLIQGKGKEQ
ncbi:MAG: MlaD family protein [Deltaproteobacteria bacterium]|jgi:paraquat-inducible protein B|nr:MlaD family protein [Deltaproteobacteria bacterium]